MAQTFISTDDLNPGDVVATIGSGNGFTIVAKALPLVLAAFGRATGVATDASSRSAVASIQTVGAIPAAKTGLAAVAGPVRVSSTARCELVTAYATGDYPLGTTDSGGLLTLNQMTVTPVPAGNIDTRASVQAVLAPANRTTFFCAEVSAPYKFDATSVATADGWTILTANDATPGRWVLQGDTISIAPLTSGDDAARIQSALAAKLKVALRPGTYSIQTPVNFVSNSQLIGGPRVTLLSSIASGSGDPRQSCLVCNGLSGAKASTLAATPTYGGTTISVTGNAFAAGDYVSITETPFRQVIFGVLSIAGSNPQTLTLDRPIRNAFASGNVIGDMFPVMNVKILGNGMRIAGTGSRYIELIRSRDCEVRDVFMDTANGVPSERLMSIDESSYNVRAYRVRGDGGGSVGLGIGFESTEFCSYTECEAIRCTIAGILLQDAIGCHVTDCCASACASGIQLIGSDANGLTGSSSNVIRGGSYSHNTTYGIFVQTTSSDNTFIGVNAVGNTTYGVYVATAAGVAYRNTFVGCETRANGVAGYFFDLAATDTTMVGCRAIDESTGVTAGTFAVRTKIVDCVIHNCTTLFNIISDVDCAGLTGTTKADNSPGFFVQATGTLNLRGFSIVSPNSNSNPTNIFQVSVGGEAWVSDGKIVVGTNDCAFVPGGRVHVANVRCVKGAGASNSRGIDGNGQLIVGDGFDISTLDTPLANLGTTWLLAQSGSISKAVTTADVTLTLAETQSNAVTTTGVLTGNRNVILPTFNGMAWDVFCNNTGAFTTTFKTAAGTGIVVAQTKRARLQCDGTNIVRVSPDT